MVDPRHTTDRHDNGTHPRQPNVGGPAPDRPPAGPGDPRRKHRLWAGIAIVIGIAIIIIGGLLFAPYFAVVDPEPATTGQAPAAAGSTDTAAVQAKPGDCRTFEKTVQIAGEARTVSGRACMQNDGSWKVME